MMFATLMMMLIGFFSSISQYIDNGMLTSSIVVISIYHHTYSVEILHEAKKLSKNVHFTSKPKAKPIRTKRADSVDIKFNLIHSCKEIHSDSQRLLPSLPSCPTLNAGNSKLHQSYFVDRESNEQHLHLQKHPLIMKCIELKMR